MLILHTPFFSQESCLDFNLTKKISQINVINKTTKHFEKSNVRLNE